MHSGMAVGVVAVLLAAGEAALGQGQSTLSMKPLEDLTPAALEILNRRCVVCHTTEKFAAKFFTQAEWAAVIQDMVGRGAQLEGADLDVLRHGWKK